MITKVVKSAANTKIQPLKRIKNFQGQPIWLPLKILF